MRILLLSQWFDPEPFFKGLTFAASLESEGHKVEVLTGFPNYPGGKLYAGYRIRLFQREIMNGIRVNRVPFFPSHNNSAFLRTVNYLSFCLSAAILGPFLVRRPDVVYVYNLPTLSLAANILKLFYGSKIVMDIQDLWPESVVNSNMISSGFAISLLKKAVDCAYSSADRIAVLSPGFSKALTLRGIEVDKITVIYNWCNEFQLPNAQGCNDAQMNSSFEGHFNVVFAGTMGKMQALDSVLEAASIVWKHRRHVSFWFIGGGVDVERLRKLTREREICNVNFLPRLSTSEIGGVLKKADLLLVHLKNDDLLEITIPSKIQAYLFAGKPILVAVKGEAASLVQAASAGIACEPENPESIAEAVLTFERMEKKEREKMGERGRSFYLANLSLNVGTRKFLEVFNNAVGSGSQSNN